MARELVGRVEPNLPIREHSLATARALLAEAEGEYRAAADQFADAAERWERFGAVLEQAYALLGHGRCLVALGDPAADGTLRDARALFETMGARPRIDECDTLIARASKLSS